MKTIQAILELARTAPTGGTLAMATVMKVRGSAYRRPGARMLITADGRTAGMISGGCLENDVCERAREVMATRTPFLATYDSSSPEDIVFGLGLGCNGIVQVLIEPLTAGDDTALLAFLAACVARRQAGRVATVFLTGEIALGARLLRWPDGSMTSNFTDPALAAEMQKLLQETVARRTALRGLHLPDGRTGTALLETVAPPVPLTIFGAGDDAIPLAQLARLIGWHVTVIDARPAYATPERFPTADAVHCLRPEALLASPRVVFPPESVGMIMTHNFLHDRELLRALLPRAFRYLGILGPKSRTQRILDELAEEGFIEDGVAGAGGSRHE